MSLFFNHYHSNAKLVNLITIQPKLFSFFLIVSPDTNSNHFDSKILIANIINEL